MSTLINSTTLGNIIIVTGSVVLLLVLIKVFAWEQITSIFAEREEKIAKDIDGAEQARANAEKLEELREKELAGAKEEAQNILENAKETGRDQEAKILAAAKEEAGRLKDKAQQDIEQNKQEALTSVKGEVADLTVLLAEKIMSQNLDASSQSQLIDSYLDKLGDA